MKVLFSATHFGFLRNFQSTLRLLAERGHTIHLLAERREALDGQVMVDALVRDFPGVTFEVMPFARHRLWYALGAALRASLDYWRYLHPRYVHAERLRARAAEQAPAVARLLATIPSLGSSRGVRALSAIARRLERVLPPSPEVVDIFRRQEPDLLLLTPLLYFRSHQVDHVRAAREAGIKTVLCVGSWDHLTTKGLIHEVPDRVVVWNYAQQHEAEELHAVPSDRVIVTGAQAYDHWFETRPSMTREQFCEQVGLDPREPILLYLCSSPFIAPYEVGFIRQWIAAIRGSGDERLRRAGLLIRPHPQNAKQWQGVDLSDQSNVALWPKSGVNPIGGTARADYYHSMFFSRGVVGVNTSGQIESGIVGRPVYAVTTGEFAGTQDGTLHFQHLKNVDGGLLHLAGSFDVHVSQLSELLAGGAGEDDKARRFVEAFVRPHGIEVAATPRLVDGLEAFAATPAAAPHVASAFDRLVRAALVPLAVLASALTMERAKFRSMMLHLTRPARLRVRGLVTRVKYGSRFLVRATWHLVRVTGALVRRALFPVRWTWRRVKFFAALAAARAAGTEPITHEDSQPR
jgi:hypothetical protein